MQPDTLMPLNDERYRALRTLFEHKQPSGLPIPNLTPGGAIDYAAWLSPDLLLIVGWFHASDTPIEAWLATGPTTLSLEAHYLSYPRPDVSGPDHAAGKVLLLRLPTVTPRSQPLGTLMIRVGATTLALGPSDLAHAISDLQTLVHSGLVPLDRTMRASVLAFLASALPKQGQAVDLSLHKQLFMMREVLREGLPHCIIAPDHPEGIAIDLIMAVNDIGFYVRGWLWDANKSVTRITAVSPEGDRVDIHDRLFPYPRPDINQLYGADATEPSATKAGFICYFETQVPSRLANGWMFEMENELGSAVEVPAPSVVQDILTVRRNIFVDLFHERLPNDQFRSTHVAPALGRLQERYRDFAEIDSVVQYGTPPATADVSLIVTLYRRTDFLEQQFVHFVHDPDIKHSDLIYVLDSPEDADQLKEMARQLYQLYHIPFRVVVLKRNSGLALANNSGASLARGRLLLFLHSDVLPDQPGWLTTMTSFYTTTPGIGALGAKLLYEDDSVQHAGMFFARAEGAYLWETITYFKGMHRRLAAVNVARPVPTVTGACFMIDAALFRRLEGFRSLYVQGGNEDSDLCLRLLEQGYDNWYVPGAELYHLEGENRYWHEWQLVTQYNDWLHSHLWNERLEAMMEPFASFIT